MLKKYGDIISAMFFAVLSAGYLYFSLGIRERALSYSARLIPQLAGGAMLILSCILMVQNVIKLKKEKNNDSSQEIQKDKKSNYLKVFLTLLFIAIYVAVLDVFGFIISTAVYLTAQMFLLADKTHRKKPAFIVIAAVICSFAIYFLFLKVFNVILPMGIME